MIRLAISSGALALCYGCSSSNPETGNEGTAGGGSGSTGSGGKPGAGGSPAWSGSGASGANGSGASGASGSGASGASGSGASGASGFAGTTSSLGSGGVSGSVGTAGRGGRAGIAGSGGGAGTTASGGSGSGASGMGGTAAGTGAAGAGAAGSGGGGAGMVGAAGSAGMSSGATGMSAGCGKAPTIASSMYNNGQHITITAASMQRRFILNVPTNYDNTHPYRLVIAYHELGGNDNEMYKNQYYHLLPLSDNSAIFVAPNGQQNGAPCSGTGVGDGSCGWPNTNNSDLALADAIVAELEKNFCIDTNRIFVTGFSYGASMSYKTACERPLGGGSNGFVRAAALYAGAQLSGTCTPSKPVAYYASHGTHDSVLNYDGGVTLAQNFAKADGCTWMTPTKVTSGAHACTNMTGCSMGYPVEFCSFNGDHTPDPDSGQSGNSWEYQNVWTFLSQL
jgi:poly(3-hydroxybutyrate) depolymerase